MCVKRFTVSAFSVVRQACYENSDGFKSEDTGVLLKKVLVRIIH